ncbi:MAG TPA: hypothetical protein VHD88_03300 [Pyrinomonadaceae bacterium]|nr:hypothetical protein [Pyrinomonadaceae bacterium]
MKTCKAVSGLMVLAAIGLIGASESFAQSVAGNPSPPQSDAAAIRQRKSSVEEATQNAPTSFTVIREVAPTPRRIFVRSHSLLVRGAVVEDKLLKRREFQQLGFVITREAAEADLILELRHDLLRCMCSPSLTQRPRSCSTAAN